MKNSIPILTLATLLLTACSSTPEEEKSTNSTDAANEKIHVVTTFYPIYDLTSKVAGSEAVVENLVPAGVEPHDYEPSPREIQKVYEADLLIYNGAGVDSWVDNLLGDIEKNGVKVLNMSKTVTLLENEEGEAHEEKHAHENHEDSNIHGDETELEHDEIDHEEILEEHEEEGHEHDHSDLVYDPHFWLDPILVQEQVKAIRDVLIELKPEDKAAFTSNAQMALEKLVALDQDYKNGLKTCAHRQAIVTHDAFEYLAKQYNIELLPISGLSPEEEPSARTLANLAELSKENKIQYVFFETLASPKLAETLAQEIGAKTLALNPIEGLTQDEESQGEDYFSVMEDNLRNLKLAMECQ